jgi:hypothetical protein
MPAYQLSGGDWREKNGELGMKAEISDHAETQSCNQKELQTFKAVETLYLTRSREAAKARSNKAVMRSKICMDTQDGEDLSFRRKLFNLSGLNSPPLAAYACCNERVYSQES